MSKRIVRVFEIKEQLEKPKKSVSPIIKEIFGLGKKQAPQHQPEDEPTNQATRQDGQSAIEAVLARIFTVPGNCRRAMLFLNEANLTSLYLTQGGEAKIAKLIQDKELDDSIKSSPEKLEGAPGEHVLLERAYNIQFDLDDVTQSKPSWLSHCVLLNVKKDVWDKFVKAPDAAAKRAAFQAVIAHNAYVAVLNVNKIKAANVGSLANEDERLEKFDVKAFITAFATRNLIDAAREEQDENRANSPEAKQKAAEDAVAAATKNVVAFVLKSASGGKLKDNETKFQKRLHDLIDNAPELQGNEHLKGELIHAVVNNPSIIKSNLSHLLSRAGYPDPEPKDGAAPAQAAAAPGKPAKAVDLGDLDGAQAADIADKLAGEKTLTKQVLKILKDKYGIQ